MADVVTYDCWVGAAPFIPCSMEESKFAVVIVSADWLVRVMI